MTTGFGDVKCTAELERSNLGRRWGRNKWFRSKWEENYRQLTKMIL